MLLLKTKRPGTLTGRNVWLSNLLITVVLICMPILPPPDKWTCRHTVLCTTDLHTSRVRYVNHSKRLSYD